MTRQSRTESAIETGLNIGSGFLISLAMWTWVVSQLWHIDTHLHDNLAITGLFTITSLLRSYIWRRCFNARLYHFLTRR